MAKKGTAWDSLVRDTPECDVIEMVVTSFGFLHGPPPAADNTIDLRDALHNPAADPAMRDLTGLDKRVRDHVVATPGADKIINAAVSQALAYHASLAPRGLRARIAVGCAGGRHRSVVVANEVGFRLRELDIVTEIEHRDVARHVVNVVAS